MKQVFLDASLHPGWRSGVERYYFDRGVLLDSLITILAEHDLLPVLIDEQVRRPQVVYLFLEIVYAFRVDPWVFDAEATQVHIARHCNDVKRAVHSARLRSINLWVSCAPVNAEQLALWVVLDLVNLRLRAFFDGKELVVVVRRAGVHWQLDSRLLLTLLLYVERCPL